MNYYNEFDPHAAAWLQGLIDENLIPPGHVDTRSITEISPYELHGYTQCHFFAGIGGWSLALQLAGVPATRPLWTGSCPCQPFSVAGEGKGIEDARHLWPVFFDLIRVCKPDLVFGEQVASAAVLGSAAKPSKRSAGKAVQPVWLDGVFADLESASYACGSSDIPAAGVGAPHIRQRCWWGAVRLADAQGAGSSPRGIRAALAESWTKGEGSCGMADANNQHDHGSGFGRSGRRTEFADGSAPERMAESGGIGGASGIPRQEQRQEGNAGITHDCCDQQPGGMGDTPGGGLGIIGDATLAGSGGHAHGSGVDGGCGVAYTDGRDASAEREQCGGEFGLQPDGHGTFWSNSYWHSCRDGKHRRVPVESGLFPLVDGLSYRVARRRTVRPPLLRGAGNAICPEVGAEFVKAFLESIGGI